MTYCEHMTLSSLFLPSCEACSGLPSSLDTNHPMDGYRNMGEKREKNNRWRFRGLAAGWKEFGKGVFYKNTGNASEWSHISLPYSWVLQMNPSFFPVPIHTLHSCIINVTRSFWFITVVAEGYVIFICILCSLSKQIFQIGHSYNSSRLLLHSKIIVLFSGSRVCIGEFISESQQRMFFWKQLLDASVSAVLLPVFNVLKSTAALAVFLDRARLCCICSLLMYLWLRSSVLYTCFVDDDKHIDDN